MNKEKELDAYEVIFGNNVKKRRKALGMTQQELADKLGFESHSTIGKIEKGERSTPLDKLPDFCRVLRCHPAQLLGIEPEGTDVTVTLPEGQAVLIERINNLDFVQQRQILATIDILLKGMEDKK